MVGIKSIEEEGKKNLKASWRPISFLFSIIIIIFFLHYINYFNYDTALECVKSWIEPKAGFNNSLVEER